MKKQPEKKPVKQSQATKPQQPGKAKKQAAEETSDEDEEWTDSGDGDSSDDDCELGKAPAPKKTTAAIKKQPGATDQRRNSIGDQVGGQSPVGCFGFVKARLLLLRFTAWVGISTRRSARRRGRGRVSTSEATSRTRTASSGLDARAPLSRGCEQVTGCKGGGRRWTNFRRMKGLLLDLAR
jgi:hypothetical protein